MKAITLYQPHASLVALRAKKIETRGWKTSYRGPLAIHAGVSKKYLDLGWKEPFFSALTPFHKAREGGSMSLMWWLGYVVATCDLVDCFKVVEESPNYYHLQSGNDHREYICVQKRDIGPHKVGNEALFGDFTVGRYAWDLANVKQLEKPIPAKGKQRLWNWERKEEAQ